MNKIYEKLYKELIKAIDGYRIEDDKYVPFNLIIKLPPDKDNIIYLCDYYEGLYTKPISFLDTDIGTYDNSSNNLSPVSILTKNSKFPKLNDFCSKVMKQTKTNLLEFARKNYNKLYFAEKKFVVQITDSFSWATVFRVRGLVRNEGKDLEILFNSIPFIYPPRLGILID